MLLQMRPPCHCVSSDTPPLGAIRCVRTSETTADGLAIDAQRQNDSPGQCPPVPPLPAFGDAVVVNNACDDEFVSPRSDAPIADSVIAMSPQQAEFGRATSARTSGNKMVEVTKRNMQEVMSMMRQLSDSFSDIRKQCDGNNAGG